MTNIISHQEISNHYYYTNFVSPENYDDNTRNDIINRIKTHFGGRILAYRPIIEIGELKLKGLLRNNFVYVDGKEIGRIN